MFRLLQAMATALMLIAAPSLASARGLPTPPLDGATIGSAPVSPHVASVAALQAYTNTTAMPSRIHLDGFYGPGDGGGTDYYNVSTACPGAAGGRRVSASNGSCWVTSYGKDMDLRQFGARCDGSTDDYPAFLLAIDAASTSRGRNIVVPATGHACLTSQGISLPPGSALVGVPSSMFNGVVSSVAGWTAYGSWVQSTDGANPTVTLPPHGTTVRDVNFIRAQPIPSSTAGAGYSPAVYPCEIADAADFTEVSNVRMIGVTCGVDLSYTPGSGGGTFSHLDHLYIDAMAIGIRTQNVNDTIYGQDWHFRSMFYASNPNVVAYREAHSIGWDAHYTDNPMVDGLECFQTAACILATDGTAVGNTHALFNAQLDKLDCNLVVRCYAVASSTTTTTATIGSVLAQGDTTTSQTAPLLDIASNNARLSITSLHVPTTGGAVASVGAGSGSGGFLGLGVGDIQGYSQVNGQQYAIYLNNAGATMNQGTAVSFVGSGLGPYAGSGSAFQYFAPNIVSSVPSTNVLTIAGAVNSHFYFDFPQTTAANSNDLNFFRNTVANGNSSLNIFKADGSGVRTTYLPANGTSSFVNPVVVGSSAGGAHTLDVVGSFGVTGDTSLVHTYASGTAPALSGCGTGAAINGHDGGGRIILGANPPSTCSLTFSNAYAGAPPVCFAQDETTAITTRAITPSTGSITFSFSATPSAGDRVSYVCTGI